MAPLVWGPENTAETPPTRKAAFRAPRINDAFITLIHNIEDDTKQRTTAEDDQ